MARQSTRKKPAGKFPLTLHRTGQWCKKVRGKLLYFGKDEEAALNRWLDEKDELLTRLRLRPTSFRRKGSGRAYDGVC